MQQNRGTILKTPLIPLPLTTYKPGHPFGEAKERNDLIHQVRAQVVHNAGSRAGGGFPSASAWRGGPVAVEVRFEFREAAEGVGGE